jgi:stage II sporulation protein AA (anti-sigma F factor antagonist)
MGFEGRDELALELVDGVWLLRLRGEHDLVNAGDLEAEIEAVFAQGSKVLVDLSEATFIDSTVLNVLVRGARLADANAEHSFAVCAPAGRDPRRVLDLVAIDQVIPVFDDRDAAFRALA